MEFWTNVLKSMLLMYVAGLFFLSGTESAAWFILFALLYASVSISGCIAKREGWRLSFMAAAALLAAAGSIQVFPPLILLLPASLFELASAISGKNGKVVVLAPMLLPLAFMEMSLSVSYLLIAAFSFAYLSMLERHTDRIRKYRSEMDDMRRSLQLTERHLEESREYAKQTEYMSRLEERNRLSQDIHDKIGHSMAGALIQMEAAKRLIGTDREKSGELLQNAISISREGLESIRQSLKHTKPPAEQIGINRLKLFVDEFSARHPVKTMLTYDGNMDLVSPLQWRIIQENVKEAFTNSLKYANATVITVHLHVLNTMIRAVVTDNGMGAPKVIKGLGIAGMEERAAAVNGTVIVDGSRGFSVTTLLPRSAPS
jgi:Signal transduction histidine kinase